MPSFSFSRPLFVRWGIVLLAALMMVGTLPGRTFGLALLTESILAEFELSRTRYGLINLATALLGAGFALVAGALIDRFGLRRMATLILLCLGISTIAFSRVTSLGFLVVALVAARGFGQSALSITSLATVGKWFTQGLGPAMGVYSVLVSVFFVPALVSLPFVVAKFGWRPTWMGLGLTLLVLAVVVGTLLRNPPKTRVAADEAEQTVGESVAEESAPCFTLAEAMLTPMYWVFTLGSALFNLIVAGVIFFNESILATELNLGDTAFVKVMGVYFIAGLVGSLLTGWLVQRVRMGRVMSVALLVMCACLFYLPWLDSIGLAMLHAVPFGMAGGVVPVMYFTCYAKAFGREHLGKIQGSAQLLACFASASGPLLLGWSKDSFGVYWPPIQILAVVLGCLGLAAWFVRRPRRLKG